MSGDHIHQYGSGSIGKATHHGSGDIVSGGKSADVGQAIAGLLAAVGELRQHLGERDRAEVDAAVAQIDPNKSQSELEGPLRKIGGIAALISEHGAPVLSAIAAVTSCFTG